MLGGSRVDSEGSLKVRTGIRTDWLFESVRSAPDERARRSVLCTGTSLSGPPSTGATITMDVGVANTTPTYTGRWPLIGRMWDKKEEAPS